MEQNEVLPEHNTIELTLDDQSWLSSFGVDPSWQDDPTLAVELNELIRLGSEHINESDSESQYQQIILAREKFFDFVGVDSETFKTFCRATPTIIPLDTFVGTQRLMNTLGLDAVKIINTLPAAIGFAPESVRAKVDNLTELGLDAVKIINTLPAAIGLAPESVRAKVRFLERTVKFLQWEFTAKDIVEEYPAILSFSTKKLRILKRIATMHLTENARSITPRRLKSFLITPLEKYLLSIAAAEQTPQGDMLLDEARRIKLNARERKAEAKKLARTGELGRIGTMYLDYAK